MSFLKSSTSFTRFRLVDEVPADLAYDADVSADDEAEVFKMLLRLGRTADLLDYVGFLRGSEDKRHHFFFLPFSGALD